MTHVFPDRLKGFIVLEQPLPAAMVAAIGDVTAEEQAMTTREFLRGRLNQETGGPGVGKCVTLIEFAFLHNIYKKPGKIAEDAYAALAKPEKLQQDTTVAELDMKRLRIHENVLILIASLCSAYREHLYPGAEAIRFFKQKKDLRIPLNEKIHALSDPLQDLFSTAREKIGIQTALDDLTLSDFREAMINKFGDPEATSKALIENVTDYNWVDNALGLPGRSKSHLDQCNDPEMVRLLTSRFTETINPYVLAAATLVLASLQAPEKPVVLRTPTPRKSHAPKATITTLQPKKQKSKALKAPKEKKIIKEPAKPNLLSANNDSERKVLSLSSQLCGLTLHEGGVVEKELIEGMTGLFADQAQLKKAYENYLQSFYSGQDGEQFVQLENIPPPHKLMPILRTGATKENRTLFFQALGLINQTYLHYIESQKNAAVVQNEPVDSEIAVYDAAEALKVFEQFLPVISDIQQGDFDRSQLAEIISDSGRMLALSMDMNADALAKVVYGRIPVASREMASMKALSELFGIEDHDRRIDAVDFESLGTAAIISMAGTIQYLHDNRGRIKLKPDERLTPTSVEPQ